MINLTQTWVERKSRRRLMEVTEEKYGKKVDFGMNVAGQRSVNKDRKYASNNNNNRGLVSLGNTVWECRIKSRANVTINESRGKIHRKVFLRNVVIKRKREGKWQLTSVLY